MSCTLVASDDKAVCANCGVVSSDAVKLKDCTACRLVKYCGVDCQRAHRRQHKKACKQRAAELKDEQLYSMGHERPEFDFCPICTLPIQLPMTPHATLNVCCVKQICNGCVMAAKKRGMLDCAFCRTPIPDCDADSLAMVRARVAKKDPAAIHFLGHKYCFGQLGLQKDMQKAFELWTEAAELGSIQALYNLGGSYDLGEGVQEDKAKATVFNRKAALQGHVMSRHNLGCFEGEKGNHDRAVRHFLISAKMGYEGSVEKIKRMFMRGQATKEHYTQALKGFQDAVEEMKNPAERTAAPAGEELLMSFGRVAVRQAYGWLSYFCGKGPFVFPLSTKPYNVFERLWYVVVTMGMSPPQCSVHNLLCGSYRDQLDPRTKRSGYISVAFAPQSACKAGRRASRCGGSSCGRSLCMWSVAVGSVGSGGRAGWQGVGPAEGRRGETIDNRLFGEGPELASCTLVATDDDAVCANCGLVSSDTVKLKNCTACRLVKYCGVDCQRAHRKQHKKACKRRATELKGEQLYSQGHERLEGDFCPICTLPIPLPLGEHSTVNVCCMKRICNGCDLAAQKRGMHDCPFCRAPFPNNDADADSLKLIRARVAKKDPAAIHFLGHKYFFGELGLQKDLRKGVELYTEAAELGSIQALYNLGGSYSNGDGVQEDKAKAAELYKKAAMQGHTQSRHNLGYLEALGGNHDRAVRHLLISAKMGYKDSLENIKRMFMKGLATKEQYAEALKGHHDAVEEMKNLYSREGGRAGWQRAAGDSPAESQCDKVRETLDWPHDRLGGVAEVVEPQPSSVTRSDLLIDTAGSSAQSWRGGSGPTHDPMEQAVDI
ncbi:hypothetical protein THAOC_34664 [Thalassiosira oceanica]|uniref:MYND-type domain-containing protein n=1 Tax=Thalassiosira oceanica TaxID=159749 RepID=K0RC84_THAOC|nr:hypothetical protein THAOC_34664 [Thalassiosira oceanica]|eukprot:EJK46661.1 hypothetical protein THAOC_34664 [Thalassiosira oceanica]